MLLLFSLLQSSGIFEGLTDLALELTSFRMHKEEDDAQDWASVLQKFSHLGRLSFSQQASIINSIPSDSCPLGRSQVRFSSYFSVGEPKYIPSSLRNKILYFWRKGDSVHNYFRQLIEPIQEERTCIEKTKPPSHSVSSRLQTKRKVNEDHNDNTAGENYNDLFHISAVEESPYLKFCQKLVELGTLKWRSHSTKVDVVVMNDIDLVSGMFQINRFTHVWRYACDDGHKYTCDCKMFDMLAKSEHPQTVTKCCHIRFFVDYIEPHMNILFSTTRKLPNTPICNRISQALSYVNNGVVRLDCHKKYHKFSVLSVDGLTCVIVSLEQNRFVCHSGECRARKGHKRKVTKLGDKDLCQHLNIVAANTEEWANLLDEESAMLDEETPVDDSPAMESRSIIVSNS